MLSTATGFFLIKGKFSFNVLCSITVRSLLTPLTLMTFALEFPNLSPSTNVQYAYNFFFSKSLASQLLCYSVSGILSRSRSTDIVSYPT